MVACGYLAAIIYIFRKGGALGLKKDDLSDLVFYTVLSGILGAKLFYAATYWNEFGPDFASRAAYLFKSFQYGFVFYGGLLFGAGAFFLLSKKRGIPPFKAADLFAPALALGHAFGRIGCFLAGCCHGHPTACAVSVVFTDPASEVSPLLLGVPLHPVQLYESAGNFLIFITLNVALSRSTAGKLPRGSVLAAYAAMYSLLRFLLEFLRGDDRGASLLGLSPAQVISALAFAAAVILFTALRKGQWKRKL